MSKIAYTIFVVKFMRLEKLIDLTKTVQDAAEFKIHFKEVSLKVPLETI